jgi:hypothetical protein
MVCAAEFAPSTMPSTYAPRFRGPNSAVAVFGVLTFALLRGRIVGPLAALAVFLLEV